MRQTTSNFAVPHRRGFTLVELLVVMAILVILLLVALPVFNYVTGARSTESGINLAAAMLGRARALALSRSDNKYIGVLFYTDDQGRDAMQIVETDAADPTNTMERYFSWQNDVVYRPEDTAAVPPHAADVVYSQALDPLTAANLPYTMKPTVKRYVALQANSGPTDTPPNGTYGLDPTTGTNQTTFVNTYWNTQLLGNTVPVALDAEVQYLPRGVRARVVLDNGVTDPVSSPGIVLFDKQGRLTKRRWAITHGTDVSIDGGEKLLENMGLTSDLPLTTNRISGVALAVYNDNDLVNNVADPKNANQVDQWVRDSADQYTISQQSGELLTAGK